MNKKFRSYLKDVCVEVKNWDLKKEVYRELRSHLLDLYDCEIENGKPHSEAIETVLKTMAPAKRLGRKINLANRTWFWRYPLITLSFSFTALCLVSLIFCTHYLISEYMYPRLINNLSFSEQSQKYFIKDLKLLSADPIFPETTRSRNAADFLKLHISGLVKKEGLLTDYESLNDFMSRKHRGWRDKTRFLELLNDPEIFRFDATWITHLDKYDHLDITKTEEFKTHMVGIQRQNGIKKIGKWSSAPILNTNELSQWVLIYVAQEAKKGNVRVGLKRLRHVAGLINSNEILVDHAVAAEVLKREGVIARNLDLKDWQAVPLGLIEAYKRVSWGWADIVQKSYFEGQFPDYLKEYATPSNGFCSGVTEYSLGLNGLSDFLTPKVIFEPDYSQRVSKANKLARRFLRRCGKIEAFQSLLEPTGEGQNPFWDSDMAQTWFVNTFEISKYLPNPSRIPYVRRLVVFYLMNYATPEYEQVYIRLHEENKEI